MKWIILLLFSPLFSCFAETEVESKLHARFFTPDITSLDISDWCNPTVEDYWKLQSFMKERHVAHINRVQEESASSKPFPSDILNQDFYGWLLYRSGRIALIKEGAEMPGMHVVYFNQDPNKKDKCVICYAGHQSPWNGRDYIRGIHILIEALEKTHFDGHFIYYIGGWPSLKKGRLKYADVPFSFKPFLFEEVRDLGYQSALWLDACCIPVKSLDPIFQLIQKNGLCFYSYGSIQQWREFVVGYSYLMPDFKITKEGRYEEISTQVVGLSMSNQKAMTLLNEWILAAERKLPFLQSDEPPFVYLVNRLNLQDGRIPRGSYIETPCNSGKFDYWNVNRNAIIYHQYDFIDPQYPIPQDLFNH